MEEQYDRRDAMHRVSTWDRLTVRSYETRSIMGAAAADLAAEKIIDLLKQQDFLNIIFAAAPSQNEFLAALTQKTDIDWQRVNAFHMDEYIGLPKDAPQTFAAFLKEKIFDQLPFRTVYYINGNANDLQAECERYIELLSRYPPDIVCMGIGENAHIAFNDPHVADFNDPMAVKIVSLDTACRQQQVNDGCFAELNDVPTHALTLTVPTLMSGKFVYCMVPGEKKAQAVYHTLKAEITEKYPSSVLRKHANAMLFLDENSSSLL